MISILIHKATRGTRLVDKGLSLQKARAKGISIYEGWKALNSSFPELTVSGVCVLLVKDADAEAVMCDRRNVDPRVLEQYGSS